MKQRLLLDRAIAESCLPPFSKHKYEHFEKYMVYITLIGTNNSSLAHFIDIGKASVASDLSFVNRKLPAILIDSTY